MINCNEILLQYKLIILLIVLSCVVILPVVPAHATVSHFQGVINGASEVDPTTSTATGFGSFSYDDIINELTYDISFIGLSSTETASHIHQAPVGIDGPVIFALPTGSPKNGVVILSASQETSLFTGQLYVNIHSTNFSGGEIRGQILILSAGDCVVSSGNWIIQQSCNLASSAAAPANVIVQNGAVLTIPNGRSLNIDFVNHHLLVQSGGGVLIKAGSKIF